MKTILRDLIERGVALDEASDIPEEDRPNIIRAWRESARPLEVVEAFREPTDERAELILEAVIHDTSWIASGTPFSPGMKQLISAYWWRQISWMVDRDIQELQSEMRQERKDEEREFKLHGVAV